MWMQAACWQKISPAVPVCSLQWCKHSVIQYIYFKLMGCGGGGWWWINVTSTFSNLSFTTEEQSRPGNALKKRIILILPLAVKNSYTSLWQRLACMFWPLVFVLCAEPPLVAHALHFFLITPFHFLSALALCLLFVLRATSSAAFPFITPAGEDKTLWPYHWRTARECEERERHIRLFREMETNNIHPTTTSHFKLL